MTQAIPGSPGSPWPERPRGMASACSPGVGTTQRMGLAAESLERAEDGSPCLSIEFRTSRCRKAGAVGGSLRLGSNGSRITPDGMPRGFTIVIVSPGSRVHVEPTNMSFRCRGVSNRVRAPAEGHHCKKCIHLTARRTFSRAAAERAMRRLRLAGATGRLPNQTPAASAPLPSTAHAIQSYRMAECGWAQK
jgi:hypothetical protein